MKKFTAVILAGGNSSRMKTNKAFCKIGGKMLIEFLISTFEKRNYRILISGNKEEYTFLDKEIVEDNYKNIGPLAGIEAGLKASSTEYVIFSSCDTPFIGHHLLNKIEHYAKNYEVIVPKLGDYWQPMNAFYRKNMHLYAKKLILKKQAYPKDLIRKSKYKELAINDRREFFNINTPNDLRKAQSIINQLIL